MANPNSPQVLLRYGAAKSIDSSPPDGNLVAREMADANLQFELSDTTPAVVQTTAPTPRTHAILDNRPPGPVPSFMRKGHWHYGFCVCCAECDSCCEAWCCTPCQISRQFNMQVNNTPSVHWPICCTISCLDCWSGCGWPGCLFAYIVRQTARKRYGIRGSGCRDGWAACCCRPCLVQQTLLEMTCLGDFPGASCYMPTERPQYTEMQ